MACCCAFWVPSCFYAAQPSRLEFRKNHTELVEILPFLIVVRYLAHLIALEKQHLPNTLVCVDSCRKRCRIRDLQRNIPPPPRLKRGRIQNDTATGIGRLSETDTEHIAR